MSKKQTEKVRQVGGDKDWWGVGGIFLREFTQDDVFYRELWHTEGLEDTFPGQTLDDEDDPKLKVKVYRVALPTDPKDIVIELSNKNHETMKRLLTGDDEEEPPNYATPTDRIYAEMLAISDTNWVNFKMLADQYKEGLKWFAALPDYAIMEEAMRYYGWVNGDNYPDTYTQAEIVKMLDLEHAEMF